MLRSTKADGRSAATRRAYATAIAWLETLLTNRRLPTILAALEPDHLEAFFVALYQHGLRPTTLLARHHALARFFGWLVEEGELATPPMGDLHPPATPLLPATALTNAQIEALLAACAGAAFEDVRDAAMIRLFVDTGLRLTELAVLQLDDVSLELDAVYVAGSGRAPRAVPFDKPTARAIERHLVARGAHPWAHLSSLWLGRRRHLTARGVDQAVRHRGHGGAL